MPTFILDCAKIKKNNLILNRTKILRVERHFYSYISTFIYTQIPVITF